MSSEMPPQNILYIGNRNEFKMVEKQVRSKNEATRKTVWALTHVTKVAQLQAMRLQAYDVLVFDHNHTFALKLIKRLQATGHVSTGLYLLTVPEFTNTFCRV